MTTKVRLKKATFRYIESEIAHYYETVKEIRTLKQMMYEEGASRRFTFGGGGKSGGVGDPTAERAAKVLQNRQVQHLERVRDAIETVYEGLPEEKKRLVEVYYWDKPQRFTWDGIAEKFHYSKKTLQRWRDAIVEEVAEKLGMM